MEQDTIEKKESAAKTYRTEFFRRFPPKNEEDRVTAEKAFDKFAKAWPTVFRNENYGMNFEDLNHDLQEVLARINGYKNIGLPFTDPEDIRYRKSPLWRFFLEMDQHIRGTHLRPGRFKPEEHFMTPEERKRFFWS